MYVNANFAKTFSEQKRKCISRSLMLNKQGNKLALNTMNAQKSPKSLQWFSYLILKFAPKSSSVVLDEQYKHSITYPPTISIYGPK
jgi:hypothetical protein